MAATHAVLAGRRVDAADSHPSRFPLTNVPVVQKRIATLFEIKNVRFLTCSAACGADLLALQTARLMRISTTVILPYDDAHFVESSVADRPGNWVDEFYVAIKYAEISGKVVVLDETPFAESAFAKVTAMLFENTDVSEVRLAVAVWDKVSRGKDDATQDFIDRAHLLTLPLFEISTDK